MSKFIKVCVGIGLSLFIIGLFISAVSFAFGARIYYQDYMPKRFAFHGEEAILEANDIVTEAAASEFNVGMNPARGSLENSFDSISDIDINLNFGQLELYVDAGATKVTVSASNLYDDLLECFVEDDTLYIRYSDDYKTRWKDKLKDFQWEHSDEPPYIQVRIPESMAIEDSVIYIGAGEASITNFKTESLEVRVDAGSLNGTNIGVEDTTTLILSAGSIYMDNCKTKELIANCNAGELNWNGSILSDSKIECNAGSVYLQLENSEKDFDYNIKNNIGRVRVGNDYSEGVSSKKILDNDASNTIELSCNMGSIDVEFDIR